MHFISGLPRSGSTLFAAILRQNPRFHTGMSTPLASLVTTVLKDMSASPEVSVLISDEQRERITRGLFSNYYGPECDGKVVVDTNRAWCAMLPLLRTLFPQSRIIACARHLPWVYDSFERLSRRNVFHYGSMYAHTSGNSVYGRAAKLSGAEGVVGFPYNALREAFYSAESATQLLVLQYETLVSEPARAMAAVYDFLGEPAFSHDFNNIENYVETHKEFDGRIGIPGMHAVGTRVVSQERPSVLPPDLFRNFENESFWRNPQLNRYGVKVV